MPGYIPGRLQWHAQMPGMVILTSAGPDTTWETGTADAVRSSADWAGRLAQHTEAPWYGTVRARLAAGWTAHGCVRRHAALVDMRRGSHSGRMMTEGKIEKVEAEEASIKASTARPALRLCQPSASRPWRRVRLDLQAPRRGRKRFTVVDKGDAGGCYNGGRLDGRLDGRKSWPGHAGRAMAIDV